MIENKKRLTLFEASSIVAGLGVGGGIMAVPYLASLNGIIPVISIMLLAYFISVLIHLMVTEVVMRDGGENQLVEIFGKYLFRGRGGVFFTWFFFVLIVINFFTLLAGYIVGSGDILVNLMGIPLWTGELMIYIIAAGVVFFRLKALGISEKYAIIGIALLLIVLSIGSLGRSYSTIPVFSGRVKEALALYGMLMFSFACFFSIPQAAEGLSWNKKIVPWSVAIGIGINFIFILTLTLMAILVSKEVTEVAIIGWGKAIGTWALILGSVFVLLAILTSYWSVSYALAIVLEERLGWRYRTSWLFATLPTLLLALTGITGFLGFLRIAGGAIAVFVAILVVPTLRSSRKHGGVKEQVFTMGFWGNTCFQWVAIIAYILMAVGSVVSLD